MLGTFTTICRVCDEVIDRDDRRSGEHLVEYCTCEDCAKKVVIKGNEQTKWYGRSDPPKEGDLLRGAPLQDWWELHPVPEDMLWRGGADHQILFMRDELAPLLVGWDKLNRDEQQRFMRDDKKLDPDVVVISEHRSKSIILPVVRIRACGGALTTILRNNFYDWSATFLSRVPVNVDFFDLVPLDSPPGFEGFPKQLQKRKYEPGAKEFSISVHSDYQLWTACFLIRSAVARAL